jgi:hypothetical protein
MGFVAIPIGLPTGEFTGSIGITEAKLPKEFHLSNMVTLPNKTAQAAGPPLGRAVFFYSNRRG